MKDASVESARFEPTVIGAVRRYPIIVVTVALLAVMAAIAYTLHKGSMYSNSPTTGDWESYVAVDLVAYVDSHYRTIPNRLSPIKGRSIEFITLRIREHRSYNTGKRAFGPESTCLNN